jgi:DNA-binding LacI/PurR family transcriptional regulator
MRVPTYEIGRRGASLLLEALGNGDPADAHLRGEIIERDSVATIGQLA